jgi:phage terminase large subunit
MVSASVAIRQESTYELPAVEARGYQQNLWSALWEAFDPGGIRRFLEIAHRRWGKDEMALNWSACAAHQRVGSYWHMLPEYAQAKKAIWSAVNPHTGKRRIDEAFPRALRASTNETEMFIRFKNGSTWQVIGSDNYNRLVGASVAGVTFSEFATANPAAWAYIAPILAENDGWALFITTPRGRNHVYKMMLSARRQPNEWYCEVSTVDDTKQISNETIEKQRLDYHALYGEDAGDALIEQEYRCSFDAAILGAYYGKELVKAQQDGRITLVEADPNFPVHTAWDLGVDDANTIWFFQLAGPELHIVYYYEASNYAIPHYAEKKLEFGQRFGWNFKGSIDYVPHDALQRSYTSGHADGTAKQRIEVMVEEGLNPVVVPNHTKLDGISAVRQLLPRCIFDEKNCEAGLEALRQYQREWDDENKVFKKTPLHNWASHGADGFRTLAMGWKLKIVAPPKEPDVVDPAGRGKMLGLRPQVLTEMTYDQFAPLGKRSRRRDRI